MKVTVCELPNTWTRDEQIWQDLISHLETEQPDLLLLPEMPFFEWITRSDTPDPAQWEKAVKAHEDFEHKLDELPVPFVAGSRPVNIDHTFLNQGFIRPRNQALIPCHEKYYLPDEPGYYEASWYSRGNGNFERVSINGVNLGFMICTELWFTHRAREYMAQDVHIILCPRATPESENDIWVPGGRAAAIVGGAFCLSSNYNGPNVPGEDFGGTGWIIEPERGKILGLTSSDNGFVTLDIDPEDARQAKETYPRYVQGDG